ncbi:hypothetical protein HK104_006357, partial [Borealophlyctis nickersoniae]
MTYSTTSSVYTNRTWPTKMFAPYVDVLLWPTLDISVVANKTGVKYFTLAFVISDAGGNPAWGGMTPIQQGFYADVVAKVRSVGGDVVVSFGGANGQEIAQTNTDVPTLASKYQLVIDTYQIGAVDFDIEGGATVDPPSIDRRNKAIKILQTRNPRLRVSYTLPVMPSGLTAEGVAILKNAAANGVRVDVVNVMAMDYGGGEATNGATGMGGYAISAGQNTYKQALAAGLGSNVKVGICPMIGQNDVAAEIFRLADALQLVQWAATTPYVSHLAMWSVNRDTSVKGPLYASSQIQQADYAFSNIFKAFQSKDGAVPGVSSSAPASSKTTAPATTTAATATSKAASPAPAPTMSKGWMIVKPASRAWTYYTATPGLKARSDDTDTDEDDQTEHIIPSAPDLSPHWKSRTFAPYVDITADVPFDFASAARSHGVKHYTLGFIVSDTAGNPSWGPTHPLDGVPSLTSNITSLREFGGDVIISFGGAVGTELAVSTSTAAELQVKYQSVIDMFNATWIDFAIEGEALEDVASCQRRVEALVGIKRENEGVVVGFTVPVEQGGLDEGVVRMLEAAVKAGLDVDVINLLTMDFDPATAPYPTSHLSSYILTSVTSTYTQLISNPVLTPLAASIKLGITPMIGINEHAREIFTLSDAQKVVDFTRHKEYVALLSYWNVNRDHGEKE